MKKIISLIITMMFCSLVVPPTLAADSKAEQKRQLLRTQRQIQISLRKAQHDSDRLTELKLQLRVVQSSYHDLSHYHRLANLRRPVQLAPVTVVAPAQVVDTASGFSESGKASYYGSAFNGRHTASGDVFNDSLFTAAHLTLPFGTKVKVTDPTNGNSVVVTINDRGPHVAGRIIDLTSAAFSALEPLSRGVIEVQLEVQP